MRRGQRYTRPMTKLRDALIILVLGGVVLFVLVHFLSGVHLANINGSPIVREAEIACIEDEVLCHVGLDSFSSEADAQAYLESPRHQQALKIKALKIEQDHADAELHEQAKRMAAQGVAQCAPRADAMEHLTVL